jgi:hypothetical protein
MPQVWIVSCLQQPNLQTNNLAQQCQSQNRVVIQTTTEALASLQISSQPVPNFNSADVMKIFSLGFGVVLLFFVVSRGIGQVLQIIRRG